MTNQHQEHLFGVVRYGLRVHDPTDETRLAANEALARIQEQLQAALDREAGTSDALQEEIERATENGRLAKRLHEQLEAHRRLLLFWIEDRMTLLPGETAEQRLKFLLKTNEDANSDDSSQARDSRLDSDNISEVAAAVRERNASSPASSRVDMSSDWQMKGSATSNQERSH